MHTTTFTAVGRGKTLPCVWDLRFYALSSSPAHCCSLGSPVHGVGTNLQPAVDFPWFCALHLCSLMSDRDSARQSWDLDLLPVFLREVLCFCYPSFPFPWFFPFISFSLTLLAFLPGSEFITFFFFLIHQIRYVTASRTKPASKCSYSLLFPT